VYFVYVTDTSRRCGYCVTGWRWVTAVIIRSSTVGWTTNFAPVSADSSAGSRASPRPLVTLERGPATRMRCFHRRRPPSKGVKPVVGYVEEGARLTCRTVSLSRQPTLDSWGHSTWTDEDKRSMMMMMMKVFRPGNGSPSATNVVLFRPPVYGSNGRSYKMLVMFFFLFSFATRSPKSIAANMIGNCLNFLIKVQKFGGPPPKKNLGPKTCKISVDFIQPPTLIANISGTVQDI